MTIHYSKLKIHKGIKRYGGMALMTVGAVLLLVCYMIKWESNGELLTGLGLVIGGYILHLWLQKQGERY